MQSQIKNRNTLVLYERKSALFVQQKLYLSDELLVLCTQELKPSRIPLVNLLIVAQQYLGCLPEKTDKRICEDTRSLVLTNQRVSYCLFN